MKTQTQSCSSDIKILIATDNHLGYKESTHSDKSERFKDSFDAFEEVLQKAVENKVDFVLLGGDLFHEKQPSQRCLLNCMEILQKYVFGDYFQGIQMERTTANYEPNFSNTHFNIGLPLFIINGNHDYHSSDENLEQVGILDILHTSQYLQYLLNYFGKVLNQHEIIVKPLIFFKDPKTKIAIYGIGYVEDSRLNKLLKNKKVVLEDLDQSNYNILVIHQNRYKGIHYYRQNNFIDPSQFKDFNLNLIIWGHEHEAKYTFETFDNNLKVFQPGSTVATSILEAENLIKQVGLLTVSSGKVDFESIKLKQSYRPMHIRDVNLEELVSKEKDKSMCKQDMAEKLLVEMIDFELNKHFTSDPFKHKKPILRIKLEHTDYDAIRIKRLEGRFIERVVNPDSIFKFWKKKHQIELNIQRQQLQIEDMNKDFILKLESKDGFSNQNNIQLVDCSRKFKQNISSNTYKVLKPQAFEQVLEQITNNRDNKNGIDEILVSVQNQLNHDNLQPKIREINQIVDEKIDVQVQLADEISNLLEFKQVQSVQYKQNQIQNYNKELTLFYNEFREDIGGALQRVDFNSETYNGNGFIEDNGQNQKKSVKKPQKVAEPKIKKESKLNESDPNDDYLQWIHKDIKQDSDEGQDSVQIMEEEFSQMQFKKDKKAKKPPQVKREQKKISSKSKTNLNFF